MRTDDLIAALATDAAPVQADAVQRRLFLALGIGGALSAGLMLLWLGLRPDLMPAMMSGPFWMKFAYALSVAILGLGLVERLARPDGEGGVFGPLILVPLGVMIALALWQLGETPRPEHNAMITGGSMRVCARNIVVLSLPLFAALFWALRALAPTRLTLAGAAAGVLAGAAGTFVYQFHCTETTAPFVAVWYTLGIVAMAALGAALGRVLLRW